MISAATLVISKHSPSPPHPHTPAGDPERAYTNNSVAITHPLVRLWCPGRGRRCLPLRRGSLVRTVVPVPAVVPLRSDGRRNRPNRPCRRGSSPSQRSRSTVLIRSERLRRRRQDMLFTILSNRGKSSVYAPAKTFDNAAGPYAP